jgi:rhodanese-related sulfurtransferase
MTPTEVDINIHSINEKDLKNYEMIDIRETQEIAEWPPLKTCKHIPFSQFPLNKDQFDKNKTYLLFCAKGSRSHFMAEELLKDGYKVFSINHGIPSVNSYLKKLES